MLFLVSGYFRGDVDAEREAIHERFNEHLAQRAPRVRYGGPLYDEAGARSGVMLLVEGKDFVAVKAFADASPYKKAGLYERVIISEIRTEVGGLY